MPVESEQPRGRGRPRKLIDPAYLAEAMSGDRNISISLLARILGVHRHTVRKEMKRHGIQRDFSNITDDDLDDLFRFFRLRNPEGGLAYFLSFLRDNELRVQRNRVTDAMRRVDPLEEELRRRAVPAERVYEVTRPNKVWHMDGHHKLIRYGIVVHGFADGYCRTVRS